MQMDDSMISGDYWVHIQLLYSPNKVTDKTIRMGHCQTLKFAKTL